MHTPVPPNRLCFYFVMATPANGGTTSLPQKLPGHSSVTWITLYFVQKGLVILSLSSKSTCLWLLRMCVCVRACVRVHMHVCAHVPTVSSRLSGQKVFAKWLL